MPVPGKTMTPIGRTFEHLVVALERCGLGVLGPVGLEGDLRHLAVVGPAARCVRRPSGDPPCSSTMSGCLAWTLSSVGPDQPVVVEVEPAGEGDLRSAGQQHLGLGAALGGEEVAAVDHRRGQVAMVDHRSRAWPPGEPVWRSKCSAAWSRKSSMALRRSIRVSPRRSGVRVRRIRPRSRPVRAGCGAAPARCRRVRARSGRRRDGRG
jgi:hypothetical protein